MKVNKTISLPLGVINLISEESFVMKKDFSSTCVVLLKIGLAQRRSEGMKERKEIEDEAKRMLGL